MNKDLLVAVGDDEAEKILKDVANGKIKKIWEKSFYKFFLVNLLL